MSKIRVLLIEDSLTVRKRLIEVLDRDPSFEVVGEAADGQTGIQLCLSLHPDVITMDLMLPGMNGLAATEYIMGHCPTPILIVSASSNRGEVFTTYDALAAGAVEVVEKPDGEEADVWERKFLSTLRIVSRVRVITHPRARLFGLTHKGESEPPPALPTGTRPAAELVVIGASTGGPIALTDYFRALPERVALPVLIVMHISSAFAPAFGEWLRSQIGRGAAYAQDGEAIASLAGCVRLAPADVHLSVRGGRLRLVDEPPRHSCRPSVDVLFESAAREYGNRSVACLLTGMGRDGATGLLALRRTGALTMAQDEASCVVYGMPREAVQLNAAERVLSPAEMARLLGQIAPVRGARTNA